MVTGSYIPTEMGPSEPAPSAKYFPREAKREYWNTQRTVTSGYGAYAYLIFTADPRSIDRTRCLKVCEAFNGYLTETRPTISVAEKKAQMVTFWPLTTDYVGAETDCTQLIANYDRQFASRVAALVQKHGRGPLLVAWTKPYGETNSEALVLDMSRYGEEDVGRAIEFWKGQLARNPETWQKGWKAAVVKEELRNAVENVLPGVVTVVATFFKPSKSESAKPE
jgi:hypothetical protein